MIRLCLFDLDNTLLMTRDLERFRGHGNVGVRSREYLGDLKAAFHFDVPDRYLYSEQQLEELKRELPNMKWGVFTRSPGSYARTILADSFPKWSWDVIVAREDVTQTKPHPEGVWKAMRAVGVQNANEVAVVGDEKSDVLAAYRSGAWSILDQSSWTKPWAPDCYRAMERVPDTVIQQPTDLGNVLSQIKSYLPDLECRLAGATPLGRNRARFDTITHFHPNRSRQAITVLGKMFSEYQAIRPRSEHHVLTQQILAHKGAVRFPDEWVQSIRSYLYQSVATAGPQRDLVITVIPKKPDGVPRMESLLVQLALSLQASPIQNFQCRIHPEVMAFSEGVVSAHGQHLTAAQRFENVEKHLNVADAAAIQGRPVLVIDDVVTSGASLVCASRALTAAGASQVKCLALAKAVSDK